MFKRIKKKKQVVFRDYLVIGSSREIDEIKLILKHSLVNNDRKIVGTLNKFEIYKNRRVARIRFVNDKQEKTYLDGLRIDLALTSKNCSNYMLNLISKTTTCYDGESLYLCDPTIKQLVGDILTFTEGVEVDVEKGL